MGVSSVDPQRRPQGLHGDPKPHLIRRLGHRHREDPDPDVHVRKSESLGIRFLGGLVSWLSGTRITDPTSGLRCAGPRAWRRFARRYPDDYPEPESLFWCLRHGLRVGEVPVRMFERQGGVSSIGVVSGAYYMIKVTLAILIERLRFKEALAE